MIRHGADGNKMQWCAAGVARCEAERGSIERGGSAPAARRQDGARPGTAVSRQASRGGGCGSTARLCLSLQAPTRRPVCSLSRLHAARQ